jgi:oxygen-independent coproporphyrinogen-3 oxidase
MARGQPLLEDRKVARSEIGFEFMLNTLRLSEGVPVSLFAERTGFPLTLVQKELGEAEARGLVEIDHMRVRPTPLGRRFLNDLQTLFLPAKDSVDSTGPVKAIAVHGTQRRFRAGLVE